MGEIRIGNNYVEVEEWKGKEINCRRSGYWLLFGLVINSCIVNNEIDNKWY